MGGLLTWRIQDECTALQNPVRYNGTVPVKSIWFYRNGNLKNRSRIYVGTTEITDNRIRKPTA